MIFLAVVLVLGLAYLLRGVLVPLFLAFLLAYALDPFVDRLEALRVPRPLGAILVMLGIAGLVSVVARLRGPDVRRRGARRVERPPGADPTRSRRASSRGSRRSST